MQNELNIIDVHELKKRHEADPNLILIDVRELSEWNEAHIPWAKHIPKSEINQTIQSICPDLNTPVYLHCRGGTRSQYAGQSLLEQGYQHVYSITGGIVDWIRSNYEYLSEETENIE